MPYDYILHETSNKSHILSSDAIKCNISNFVIWCHLLSSNVIWHHHFLLWHPLTNFSESKEILLFLITHWPTYTSNLPSSLKFIDHNLFNIIHEIQVIEYNENNECNKYMTTNKIHISEHISYVFFVCFVWSLLCTHASQHFFIFPFHVAIWHFWFLSRATSLQGGLCMSVAHFNEDY